MVDEIATGRLASGWGYQRERAAAWAARLLSSNADVFPPGSRCVGDRPPDPYQLRAGVSDLARDHAAAASVIGNCGCVAAEDE